MKPITYWEAKIAKARQQLLTLELLSRDDRIPNFPPKRVLRNKWRSAVTRWRAVQSRVQHRQYEIKKLKARILYFEDRIAKLMPTFWERLTLD